MWICVLIFVIPIDHGDVLSCVLFVDVEDTDAKFIFNSNRRTVLQKKDDKATNFSNLLSGFQTSFDAAITTIKQAPSKPSGNRSTPTYSVDCAGKKYQFQIVTKYIVTDI